MKKSLLILFTIILAMLMLSACGKKENNPNTVIQYLKSLNTYTCDVTIHIKNSRQEIDMETKLVYHKDFGHRLEVNKERVLIYKENEVRISDLVNNMDYTLDNKFDQVYKLSFIQQYIGLLYTDEEIKNTFKKIEDREYQLISLDIPGNNRNMNKAIMYVDIETKLPSKLSIYDNKDNEVISYIYTNFVPNAEINEEIFNQKVTKE
jgi:outer membrane lipoprotein-sorting protein